MTGTIRIVGDVIFVEYATDMYLEPRRTRMRWRVQRIVKDPYRPRHPEDGQTVTDSGLAGGCANWRGEGYSVHFPGDQIAEWSETTEIPPPKVREGTETRYHQGGWQKYNKRRGWINA